jgi:hypothetical protein
MNLETPILDTQEVHGGILGCDVVWTYIWVPTFRKNILPPSSGPKFTQRRNPENHHPHLHRCEKLKWKSLAKYFFVSA